MPYVPKKIKLELNSEKLKCPCCGVMEMDAKFLEKLQTVQVGYGGELPITSGYRCVKHNAEIGGSPHSFHCLGKAVDIACTDSVTRAILVGMAVRVHLNGVEVDGLHVHLDDRESSPVIILGAKLPPLPDESAEKCN